MHLNYCQGLARLDANSYPERLGACFIINAPTIFAGSFKIISSWLDPKTREKVKLLGGPAAWRPKVAEMMDPKQARARDLST